MKTYDKKIKRQWECVYEDYDATYQTRKEFSHDFRKEVPEEPCFKYRYLITVNDIDYNERYGMGEKPEWAVSLYLVVSPESLCEKVANQVKECCGDYLDYQAVLSYGTGVICLEETTVYGLLEKKQTINTYMRKALEEMEMFRGFMIDKQINAIGSAGWDVILTAIGKQEEFFPWCRKEEIEKSE